MPVKIRLQRHGKKGKPYYWIVAADARSKRDGKYLDKLGIYNPTVNPAQIEIDVDGAVKWLQNGAQPTDTARAILSYKGVLLKHHLAGGVRKGALTEEQAEEKFNAWLEEKATAVDNKRAKLSDAQKKAKAEALAAEKVVNEKRTADAAAALAPAEEEVAAEEVAAETTEAVEATEAAPAEEVVAEEAPAAEEKVAEEAPAAEEKVAEKAPEAPAAEEKVAEEAPAAEAAKEEE
ncbi:SSU ribosomal protein S16P [Ulvibacter sp. MAR_2010_11]|uniref:30S ribosomal protein S16 n=1 Tax=Ulvibacter sp. MAR_2010_11 TaxID=1250229 RepID=UPI000C2B9C01|nr:30S ribosomal protein S16 [Ulvibacter sp. MAR_2010_11]PKA82638.1 SSU ribosomal protein S16P [Ulvibacter sp. MAR_2010_11]